MTTSPRQPVRRQHLVSRGLLKAWSDDGRRVLLIDKQAMTSRLVGTNDVFVHRDVLTVKRDELAPDALETAFGTVESHALPAVRDYVAGRIDSRTEGGVKALLALHFGRSLTVRNHWDDMRLAVTEDRVAEVEADQDLRERFHEEHGRPPLAGELARITTDIATEIAAENLAFALSVERFYNRLLDELDRVHIQRVTVAKPNRGELLLADAPFVVLANGVGSADAPVAWNDSDTAWIPLSPTVAAAVSTIPIEPLALNEDTVRRLNQTTWAYAHRRLVARSSASLPRALGYTFPKITRTGPAKTTQSAISHRAPDSGRGGASLVGCFSLLC